MIKEKVTEFLKNELVDFTNFRYEIEEEDEYLYVIFKEIFGEECEIETSFKMINDILYFHSTSFGWKAIQKGSMNKFLWIELLKK